MTPCELCGNPDAVKDGSGCRHQPARVLCWPCRQKRWDACAGLYGEAREKARERWNLEHPARTVEGK